MLGILGGTFDPVHVGHLRLVLELRDRLPLERTLLMPSAEPPHRDPPQASAEDRLAMVRLAVEALHARGVRDVQAEDLEFHRPGPSYMVDSLERLREREGDQSLALILGMDALLGLPGWHRWRRILELAHLVVVGRPGGIPGGASADWARDCIVGKAEDLRARAAGGVLHVRVPELDISASAIRASLARGQGIHFLTPTPVIEYIQSRKLYTSPTTKTGNHADR